MPPKTRIAVFADPRDHADQDDHGRPTCISPNVCHDQPSVGALAQASNEQWFEQTLLLRNSGTLSCLI